MDFLMNIAATMYAQLATELILNSGKALSQKFKTPEKERAVERCIHSALVGLLTAAEHLEDSSKKRLKKILENFFDDDHTVQELKALLRGNPANREELWAIFQDCSGKEGSVAGFDFERAIDLFEAAFIEAAAGEPELAGVIQVRELRAQSKLQEAMLHTTGEMVRYLKSIDHNTLQLRQGVLTAQSITHQQILRFEIPAITIQIEPPKEPIPVRDVGPQQREEKQLEKAQKRYLESLARDCLNLPLSVLGDDTAADDELSLEAVYIDLDTTAAIVVDKKGKKISDRKISDRDALQKLPDKETRPLKVRDAAKEHKKLVLLGDPGAGKSTFVRMLCALLARANLTGKNYPEGYSKGLLPIFIQLRDLAPKTTALKKLEALPGDRRKDALINTVQQQIEENLRRLEAESFIEPLREALRQGRCLLVLDGLDEVPFGQRELVQQTVSALIGKYSPERIIVTCRIRSYSGPGRLPDFQEFTIAALDGEKIKKFVAAWYRAKKELGKLDAEQERKRVEDLQRGALNLMELAQNPMMLTTMAIIHYNKHQLPDERVKLYKLVVDILLRRWRKERLGKEGLKVSPALAKLLEDDRKLHELAARLGYQAQSTGKKERESADIERQKAIFILKDEGYLPGLEVAEEFLDYADQQSGLLVGRGGEYGKPVSYGFYHRTFQEYLAGCHIVSQRHIATELINLSKEEDYWASTVQFGFEELYYNEFRRGELTLKELACQLCPGSLPQSVPEARQILWASNIAVLLKAEAIAKDSQFLNGGAAYLGRLRKALVNLLSGSLPFPERTEAGRNLAALGDLDGLKIQPIYSLRAKGVELDVDAVTAMLKRLGFFESVWNTEGKGCIHVYSPCEISSTISQGKPHTRTAGNVVRDYATGLMWQQSGSPESMVYEEARKYIAQLNREKFAGFSDWRLPTLEEAMSLMEPQRKNEDLYIDPVFDKTQRWIWTADSAGASSAWVVVFYGGYCYYSRLALFIFVRAVR